MRKPLLLSLVIVSLATILSGCFYYPYPYYRYDDWGYRDHRGGREYRDGRGYYEGRRYYEGDRGGYRGYR